jgi:cytochrome c peroxidase
MVLFPIVAALSSFSFSDPDLGERLFQEARFSQTGTVSCMTCHFSPDERRGYSDFSARTQLIIRAEDSARLTVRNTTALIDLFWGETPGNANRLHGDGEFGSPEELVIAGLTGRNMGWLSQERTQALVRISEVAAHYPEFAGLSETDARDGVARAISAYMRSLSFSRDDAGQFNGSPFDHFLAMNSLPSAPRPAEGSRDYSARLLREVSKLEESRLLRWVDGGPAGKRFARHDQDFAFGPTELQGMKTFFGSRANCTSCHTPPLFTDFRFHNIGASQDEYDQVHGSGAFMALPKSRMRSVAQIVDPQDPGAADLGVWHQLKSRKAPTLEGLIAQLIESFGGVRPDFEERTLGAFKTPTLRNLGHSEPYFHTGQRRSLEDAVQIYVSMGALSRNGGMRNPDPEIPKVLLTGRDVRPLATFLRSLNEDYE